MPDDLWDDSFNHASPVILCKRKKAKGHSEGFWDLPSESFYSSKERKLWPLTLCPGAEETAHKCMSVIKQKSIISFNLVNYYVVGTQRVWRAKCPSFINDTYGAISLRWKYYFPALYI